MHTGHKTMLRFLNFVLFIYGTTAHAHHCPPVVDNMTVQENVDFAKMTGKWYVISWYSDSEFPQSSWLHDYTLNIVQTKEGVASVYSQAREPLNHAACETDLSSLSRSDTPGKLVYKSKDVTTPYWILETDYTQYAFVYGCYNVSSSGTCSGARAWIWSRATSLPQRVQDKTVAMHHDICVDKLEFQTVTFNHACQVKTHWRLNADQDCVVRNYSVVEDFDIDKYAGTWYEQRWLSPFSIPASEFIHDYQHHYVITGDGNITAYIYGRSPKRLDNCFYRTAYLRPETSKLGKFTYTDNTGTYPYWVLRTDYTQYAVVYGCYNVSSDGSCYMARSWVWSRTPTLPKHLEYEINRSIQNICVNPSAYLHTEQTKVCPSEPHWKLNENQDCKVSKITVQDDFNMDMYVGTWYETGWLAPSDIPSSERPQDFQHHYVITEDGKITGYVDGRLHGHPKDCFYYDFELVVTSPGKFLYKLNKSPGVPYWVLRTDYTQYAVVYGCYNVSSDGSCNMARSMVWSRTPTLPQHVGYEINTILQNICVNPSAFIRTEQTKACPVKTSWNLGGEKNCNVTSFKVKQDFDVNKFTRVWYETNTLAATSKEKHISDKQFELFTNKQGDIKAYLRSREGKACNYVTQVYREAGTVGKYTVTSSGASPSPLWVADTDYETYAVMYGCDQVGPDGGCLSARGSVWSRTPTLAPQLQYRAHSVFQQLCLNPSALMFKTNKNACPPQDVGECPKATGSGTMIKGHWRVTYMCATLIYCFRMLCL